MESADFRRHAHDLVDWMADYLDRVEELPVKAQVRPGEIAAQLPQVPPQVPEPMEDILADFRSVVVPGMTHWQHPSFFAYFQANSLAIRSDQGHVTRGFQKPLLEFGALRARLDEASGITDRAARFPRSEISDDVDGEVAIHTHVRRIGAPR